MYVPLSTLALASIIETIISKTNEAIFIVGHEEYDDVLPFPRLTL
jgi:hypothetical protein